MCHWLILFSHCRYREVDEHDPLVVWLWAVLESFSPSERVLFVRFVSGRSRLPANLADLSQRFQVQTCYWCDCELIVIILLHFSVVTHVSFQVCISQYLHDAGDACGPTSGLPSHSPDLLFSTSPPTILKSGSDGRPPPLCDQQLPLN